jgi:hypothetical protein
MTVTVDAPPAAVTPAPRRPHFWLKLVAAGLVLALIGAGIGVLVYIQTYRPYLAQGQISGPPLGAMRAVTDGVQDPTRYILVGPMGSTGTAELSLHNYGVRTVKILGLSADQRQYLSIRWITYPRDGNVLGGGFRESRAFPVALPPNGEVGFFVTATKPNCGKGDNAYTSEFDTLRLDTVSMGVNHMVALNLGTGSGSGGYAPIDICSPTAALHHLSKR